MAQTIFKSRIEGKLRFDEQYCRICLSSYNSQLKNLFSPFNTTQNIVQVIEDFAKVTITQEDEYSKLICFNCFFKLEESETFRDLIVNSDFTLRNQQIRPGDPLQMDPVSKDGIDEDSDHEKIDVDEIDIKKELISGETEQREKTTEKDIKITENVELKQNRIEDSVGEEETENMKDEKLLKVKKKRIRKPYNLKCPECDKIFKWHGARARHMMTHTKNYKYHCSFCNKGFVKKYNQISHEIIHTGESKYQCEICGKSVKSQFALLRHRNMHEGIKPFKCDQCIKAFTRKESLIMHITNKHSLNAEEPNITCNICNRQYKTRLHLQYHIRNHHKPRELGTCNICGKTVKFLTAHRKSHFKLYNCTVCNQSFGTAQALKIHAIVHTDLKYECDVCKKMFRCELPLLRHRKRHNLENHLKCELCDKEFNCKKEWKLHQEEVHQR